MNITSKQMDAKTTRYVWFDSAMEKALEYGRNTDMPKMDEKAYQAIQLLHNVTFLPIPEGAK